MNDESTERQVDTARTVKLIFDGYKKKRNPSKADYRKTNPLDVFDHQILQKLATDVAGLSFDAQ